MDINNAINSFSALSQETRLDVFRLMVKAGSKGMLAGDISQQLSIKQNTMSANLSVLTQSGLLKKEREGRNIRYFADFNGLAWKIVAVANLNCANHS
jgi:ArsR family transcriptional regulator